MTRRQQWTAVAAVLVLAGAGTWVGVRHFQVPQVAVGSRAPDFQAVTLDSVPATRSLADYRGAVTLVNVWATWCTPCERELPALERLYTEYRGKGFRIAAVSVDEPGMEDGIRELIKRFGLTFDVLYDARRAIAATYMTTGYPETFVIARNGIIRYHRLGAIDRDTVALRAVIDTLLAERAN